MLFKNAMIYQLGPMLETPEAVATFREMLTNREFVPCSGYRAESFGWVRPCEAVDDLAMITTTDILLTARHEVKVIPASSLNEIVNEKVGKLEAAEGRRVRAKECKSIRDDAFAELLPRALTKAKLIQGLIISTDDLGRLLIVGTATASEAEMFINCIRDSIGKFSVSPLQIKQNPRDAFTRWLMNRTLPNHVMFGAECDFYDIEDNSKVSCRGVDLETQEIRSHIEAGKVCRSLGLVVDGLRMSVDQNLTLRRLKVDGQLNDTPLDDEADEIAKLDYQIFTTASELRGSLTGLVAALGGLVSDD